MTLASLLGDQADGPAAVVVIGGANLDHKSHTLAPPIGGTSNPGRTRTTPGGVGRNVAENLARLGLRTSLVSAIGTDVEGIRLAAETAAAGVDVRHGVRTAAPTGSYTAIMDDRGEMVIAVSAMEAMREITVAVVDGLRNLISEARFLVLDCNVPGDALQRAAEIAGEFRIPIVADPVSVAKSGALSGLMAAGLPIHTVTPNIAELHALTGASGSGDRELRDAAELLHDRAVQNVWVRLGASGSFLSSVHEQNRRSERLDAFPATLVDVTGAGDAMLAGYVAGLLAGLDPFAAALYGGAAAAITVESPHTVDPALDFAALSARVALHRTR